MTALIVSQPHRATQISAPGNRLPRCPNTALDSAMPGAPPRLPAMEISPTRPYDTRGATVATSSTCQMFSPLKTTSPAPMVSSSTLMLAATQGREELTDLAGTLPVGDRFEAAGLYRALGFGGCGRRL